MHLLPNLGAVRSFAALSLHLEGLAHSLGGRQTPRGRSGFAINCEIFIFVAICIYASSHGGHDNRQQKAWICLVSYLLLLMDTMDCLEHCLLFFLLSREIRVHAERLTNVMTLWPLISG
ncbi:hypothetical protein IG631_07312 [Alternaria alternata]|nr:hypothetical protein IG631_07312 [Alternaria alternata]